MTASGAGDRLAPQKRAVGHVERDEIAVGSAAHELAVLDGGAAIGGRDLLALGLPDIGPALAAGLGVDGDGGAPEGEIHHSAIDERARLHRGRLLRAVEADGAQVFGVGRRDLIEIDETRAGIIVRGVKPGVSRGGGPVELGLRGTGDLGHRRSRRLRLCRRVLESCKIGEQIGPACLVRHHDRHRRARHELGRVCQELDEGLGVPGQPRATDRRGVVEALQRSRFPAGNAGQRRPDAVHAGLVGMTGRALRLIDFLARADVLSSESRTN